MRVCFVYNRNLLRIQQFDATFFRFFFFLRKGVGIRTVAPPPQVFFNARMA